MLNYFDFVLENKVYNLILESKIEFSKNFLNILGSIKHPIASDIISLQSQDKKVTHNYIDVDMSKNDTLTVIQDTRAQAMTKDLENIFVITDKSKHLKIDNFKSEEGKTQNTEIYNLLGLDITSAKKSESGDKIKILQKVVSPFDSSKVYVSYESTTNPELKAVINIDGVKEDTEIFGKLWTTHRNPLRIGRFINAMLPLTGKTYSDSEKEKFVSEYKSVLGVLNDAFSKFGILEGYDIYKFYQKDRYYKQEGTLGNSCMSEASDDMLEMYTENSEVCKMVVKWSDKGTIVDGKFKSDKIVGRALLWTTTIGEKFMDRIYTIDSSDEDLFKKFAESNGWWCKSSQNSAQTFTAQLGSATKRPTYIVQLKRGTFNGEYPYLDTLCYLNSYTGKISNYRSAVDANKLLNDTGGSYEDLDEESSED